MLLFLVDLINIEIFRISFNFFYSFSFILRSRATSRCFTKTWRIYEGTFLRRLYKTPRILILNAVIIWVSIKRQCIICIILNTDFFKVPKKEALLFYLFCSSDVGLKMHH